MVTRILLLSANPKDTDQLRLNEEFREIREGLNLSENRKQFDIRQGGATRAKDLRRLILNYRPHIVHFSGHSSTNGVFLETDSGHYNLVTGYALANLFSLFADTVKCVILNACYSRDQAIEIVQQIPYVVGMSSRIQDDSAIQFAIGFYDAIGAGRSIKDAYLFGCNAIQLEGVQSGLGTHRSLIMPVADTDDLEKYRDIQEADKPVLLTKVREIHPDIQDAANTDPVIPQSSKVNPQTCAETQPSAGESKSGQPWLPWALAASLAALSVLGFLHWQNLQDKPDTIVENETETKTEQAIKGLNEEAEQRESRPAETEITPPSITKQTVVDGAVAVDSEVEVDTESTSGTLLQAPDVVVEADAESEEIAADPDKVTKGQGATDETEAVEAETQGPSADEIARIQAAEEQKTAEEAAKRKAAADEELRRKAAAALAKKQAEEKARAERIRQQKAEQERLKAQQLAEQRRQEQIRAAREAEEARQKAEAQRAAWARQQAEKQRQEQQRRQQQQAERERQEQQRQLQQQQRANTQKESAADKMAREVEEFWFNN